MTAAGDRHRAGGREPPAQRFVQLGADQRGASRRGEAAGHEHQARRRRRVEHGHRVAGAGGHHRRRGGPPDRIDPQRIRELVVAPPDDQRAARGPRSDHGTPERRARIAIVSAALDGERGVHPTTARILDRWRIDPQPRDARAVEQLERVVDQPEAGDVAETHPVAQRRGRGARPQVDEVLDMVWLDDQQDLPAVRAAPWIHHPPIGPPSPRRSRPLERDRDRQARITIADRDLPRGGRWHIDVDERVGSGVGDRCREQRHHEHGSRAHVRARITGDTMRHVASIPSPGRSTPTPHR